MGLRAVVTPLHQAVVNRSIAEMTSLLDNGTSPDINETQSVQETFDIENSLSRLSELGFESMGFGNSFFELLLDHVIQEPVVVVSDSEILNLTVGMTPLFLAIELGFERGFELLLARGADVNVTDRDGNTPLHYAARSGNFLKELLDRGAVIDPKNVNDQTPIYFAIKNKSRKALSFLVEKGARIDTKDITGCTLLHIAVRRGFYFAIELLLEKGVEVNEIDDSVKQTPLFSAVLGKSAHMFRLLIEKGASLNVKDYKHKTPAKYNKDVKDWLKELERLKTLKIGHWSLYDVFTFSKHGDPVLVANEEMVAAIHSPILEVEFPHYARSLKKGFSLAEERYTMISEAQQYLPPLIPMEIRRLILSYLSNEDLKTNF